MKIADKKLNAELKHLQILKTKANKLAELLDYTEFRKQSFRIRMSCEYLKIIKKSDGKLKILKQLSHIGYDPVTCDYKRRKIFAQFHSKLPDFIENHPDNFWIFITLTRKECDIYDLRNECNNMKIAFNKLLKNKKFSNYFQQTGKYYKNCGYLKVMEISRYDNTHCLPHFHILVSVHKNFVNTEYLSKKKLSVMWKKALNINYLPVVDVEIIKNDEFLISNICKKAVYVKKFNEDLLLNKKYTIEYLKQTASLKMSSHAGVLAEILSNNKHKSEDYNESYEDYTNFSYNSFTNKYEMILS
jgi:hypothetical protein